MILNLCAVQNHTLIVSKTGFNNYYFFNALGQAKLKKGLATHCINTSHVRKAMKVDVDNYNIFHLIPKTYAMTTKVL